MTLRAKHPLKSNYSQCRVGCFQRSQVPYEILSARFHRPCITKAKSLSNYFEIWVELRIELTKVDAAPRFCTDNWESLRNQANTEAIDKTLGNEELIRYSLDCARAKYLGGDVKCHATTRGRRPAHWVFGDYICNKISSYVRDFIRSVILMVVSFLDRLKFFGY